MTGEVVSVVPSFRPEPRILDLVRGLASLGPVVISDDGSPCTFDPIFDELRKISNVKVIRHEQNAGVGRGLNDGLMEALKSNAAWLFTADQDSHFPPEYLPNLVAVAEEVLGMGIPVGATGALVVNDASGAFSYPTVAPNRVAHPYPETQEVIASGTLWRVEAVSSVAGFPQHFKMDAVDAAVCLSLREANFKVVAVPHLSFSHNLGVGRRVSIMGRSILLTGHSRERRNNALMNRLRLFPREWRQSPTHAIRTVRRSLVNLVLGGIPTRDR